MEFPWNQTPGTFHSLMYMEWNHPLFGLWFHAKFHGIFLGFRIKSTRTTNLRAFILIKLIYKYLFLALDLALNCLINYFLNICFVGPTFLY